MTSVTTIGTRICQHRQTLRMTQGELAEKAGISRSVLNRFENGKMQPDEPTRQRLARVFRVEPDELLGPLPEPGAELPVYRIRRAHRADGAGRSALAANLRRLRRAHRWTQTHLGQLLGVSGVAISQYESGSSQPSLESQQILSRLFAEPVMPEPSPRAYLVVEAYDGASLSSQVNQLLHEGYRLRGPLLLGAGFTQGQPATLFIQNLVATGVSEQAPPVTGPRR